MDCRMPGFPVHHQLPGLAQTHVYWVSNAIQASHPLSPPSPPAFNLSHHQGFFQWVRSLHQVPKYWSLSFSISPSNEYSGLTSISIDWFNLAVEGILKSVLLHHSSINLSVLSLFYCPAPTTVHDYWKNYSFDYTDLCWQSNVSAF